MKRVPLLFDLSELFTIMSIVYTYMLSEKVKSFLDVRYPGFLFREFQSSLLEKLRYEGFDFHFKHFFRDACNNEVVRIAGYLLKAGQWGVGHVR